MPSTFLIVIERSPPLILSGPVNKSLLPLSSLWHSSPPLRSFPPPLRHVAQVNKSLPHLSSLLHSSPPSTPPLHSSPPLLRHAAQINHLDWVRLAPDCDCVVKIVIVFVSCVDYQFIFFTLLLLIHSYRIIGVLVGLCVKEQMGFRCE